MTSLRATVERSSVGGTWLSGYSVRVQTRRPLGFDPLAGQGEELLFFSLSQRVSSCAGLFVRNAAVCACRFSTSIASAIKQWHCDQDVSRSTLGAKRCNKTNFLWRADFFDFFPEENVQIHKGEILFFSLSLSLSLDLSLFIFCDPFSQKESQVDVIVFWDYWHSRNVHRMQFILISESSPYLKR